MEEQMKFNMSGKRHCCIFNCPNNWRKLYQWHQKFCDEHGFYHGIGRCVCPPPFKLFPFPTERRNLEMRRLWTKNVRRLAEDGTSQWQPKAHSRVCSVHFVDGEPTNENPAPILNMGYVSTTLKPPRRTIKRVASQNVSASQPLELDASSNESVDKDPPIHSFFSDHSYTAFNLSYPEETSPSKKQKMDIEEDCDCFETCKCCVECLKKNSIKRKLKQKNKELEKKLEQKNKELQQKLDQKNSINFKKAVCNRKKLQMHKKLLINDHKTKFYTGLPTRELFYELYNFLHPKISKMRYWRGDKNTLHQVKRTFIKSPKKFGPTRKLPLQDELLLTLMKLRLGLLEEDIADRFETSVTSVSSIFTTWLKLLAVELKSMLAFPPKENIISNLPLDAAAFPNLRCIIDCTEVFIERPRELFLQAVTWSDYKKHNTVKVLIGITPRGRISFLSNAWGGRASDVHITNNSGFYNLIDQYDEILADKGFTIEQQLLLRHAKLIIPPGVKGKNQMTPAEVRKTKLVANFRIHVERAIGRLKDFHILNSVYPINMLPLVDDVIKVCAALCNFLPPLVTGENLYPDIEHPEI